MNILIVDDDPTMRQMLRKSMEKAGFHVFDADNGYSALHLLQQHPVSVMILDMQMPQLGGVATMRQACQIQQDLQIIILTGNPTIDNAIASIKANVADYFVKPVDLLILIAAVSRAATQQSFSQQQQALLNQLDSAVQKISHSASSDARKLNHASPVEKHRSDEISVYPLTLNKSQRLAILASRPLEPIKLSRGETAVLYALMHQPNVILSCTQIVNHAFGYSTHTANEAENVVRPYLSRLRQKIEQDPRKPKHLQTVHGQGYRFIGDQAPSD